MEFDVESFMSDVTAALAHESPEGWAEATAEDEASSHGDDSEYEEFIQYPSEESSNPPPDSYGFEVSNECLGVEPALFDLDMNMSAALLKSGSNLHLSPPSGFLPFENGVSLDVGLMLGERLDLVPSFYTYVVQSCLLPIRKVQHELITLYFQYFQSTFPLVDENYFKNLHQKYRGQEQFMDPPDFVIYQAILAAGFGYLSELQLQRTPYRSVHEGQGAQFDQVKARYWSQPTEDHVVLTQLCLIISFWRYFSFLFGNVSRVPLQTFAFETCLGSNSSNSLLEEVITNSPLTDSPGPGGVQNNSYWMNLAFKHANDNELWKTRPPIDGRPCRRRLLWWCCLVRDRVLALGMRRPYRLHRGPFEEDLISELDFSFEAASYLATDIQSKRIAIFAFIWLCKLSEIMAAIAVFQRQSKFSREWNREQVGNNTSELDEVIAFDQKIKEWKDEFEDALEVFLNPSLCNTQDVPLPVSILRIVCNSLVALLYQPYLHLSRLNSSSPVKDAIDPLQRMKEGSQGVECSVIGLISKKKIDTLPNWLVTWVTLPVTVYLVNQQVKTNPSPDRVLMPILNRFMRRTTGAQFVYLALTKALKEFVQKLNQSNLVSSVNISERKIAPSTSNAVRHINPTWNSGSRIVEATILAHVTKALDYALELRC